MPFLALRRLWPLLAAAAPLAAELPPLEASLLDTLDVIGYRPLTRDDFRGHHPPEPFLTGSPVRPVAVSCTYLVASPWSRIYAVPRPTDEGMRYGARVEGLSFVSMLSRSCSWWNREHSVSPAYVLEHEQIHFDIFEVAARRLNQEVPGLVASLDVEAGSAGAAIEGVQRHVRASLSRALDEIGVLHLRFDRETSFGFRPQRQADWRHQLDRDLKQLAEFAAPAAIVSDQSAPQE